MSSVFSDKKRGSKNFERFKDKRLFTTKKTLGMLSVITSRITFRYFLMVHFTREKQSYVIESRHTNGPNYYFFSLYDSLDYLFR